MSSLNRLRLRGHIFICNLKIGYTKNQQFLNTNLKFIYILSNKHKPQKKNYCSKFWNAVNCRYSITFLGLWNH